MLNRWGKAALSVMLLVLAAAWFGIGFELMQRWDAPLGAGLSLPTPPRPSARPQSEKPAPTVFGVQAVLTPQRTIPAPGPALQSTPAPQGELARLALFPSRTPRAADAIPRCGGPEQMIFLLIGSDTRANGYMYGLADVIRLVRIDFVTPSVSVLEFSRDLWVEIPDISDHYGITHEKLNQSYLYGNSGFGYYDGPGLGPGLLARTLELNFGARPERYAAINMQTFVRLIDALGGIEVNLPYAVDGRRSDQQTRNDLYFKAGPHLLAGREALMLARLRIGSNADRDTHQSLILCALREASLRPSNLSRLPEIINAFQDAIQTDLSPKEIGALACLAPQIQSQNIRFVSFPSEAMSASRIYDGIFKKQLFIYEADFNLMRLYTAAFQNGDWPPPAPLILNNATPASLGESFSCP
ncbi:MAG: LCP family protein [Anaerolineales bacterium]|jgi:LCP family protein required for cell wall assembly|nr:LCP family protein [Anaerolineales bacterium]